MDDKFVFEKIIITLRSAIFANDNGWEGMLYDGEDGKPRELQIEKHWI